MNPVFNFEFPPFILSRGKLFLSRLPSHAATKEHSTVNGALWRILGGLVDSSRPSARGGPAWLGIPIVADINPVFNFWFLSFVFNHFSGDGSAYPWLLRFKDQLTLERVRDTLLCALWEQLNETK
ncbi:hypothetical protein CGRA01v4_15085 [Colletotrichum graminicola]|uniref:Vid27 PH-like domain-containing protein n=1 Tax=Colletotrichum graminicola (strain M1.001 / M2 / FGSC 10212) TaxID=645133 RepID=E3R0N4_COLGM|nr:uncharacterized protein GLRG_11818 [Colletotrichum graminicola M1.001]EFQ36672.1 hypothetical protein GLRG_11818 [Colletotrichum graminicola M1.001]WDK23793.1 hypothetical protein CGRA01v4_15085 [Colletotrichum graminicola]